MSDTETATLGNDTPVQRFPCGRAGPVDVADDEREGQGARHNDGRGDADRVPRLPRLKACSACRGSRRLSASGDFGRLRRTGPPGGGPSKGHWRGTSIASEKIQKHDTAQSMFLCLSSGSFSLLSSSYPSSAFAGHLFSQLPFYTQIFSLVHRPRHHHGAVISARFPPHGCEP